MPHVRFVIVSLAIFALVLSSPASANSSVAHDPAGDATGSPAYVDITQAKVTDQAGRRTLFFSMKMAAPIPATPPDDFLAYNWQVDTDGDDLEDYAVVIRWCTERSAPRCAAAGSLPRWEGFVNHFGFGLTFFTSFSIDSSVIKVFLDPALVGGGPSFGWYALSRTVPAARNPPVGPVDFAPDTGFVPFGD